MAGESTIHRHLHENGPLAWIWPSFLFALPIGRYNLGIEIRSCSVARVELKFPFARHGVVRLHLRIGGFATQRGGGGVPAAKGPAGAGSGEGTPSGVAPRVVARSAATSAPAKTPVRPAPVPLGVGDAWPPRRFFLAATHGRGLYSWPSPVLPFSPPFFLAHLFSYIEFWSSGLYWKVLSAMCSGFNLGKLRR